MTRECPGPNPAARPRLVAPAGACDTHIHVVGPYGRYPMVPERTFTSPEAPSEMMKGFLDVMGLDRAVIVHITVSGTDPAVTLDAIAEMNGQGRGIVILDAGATKADMERMDKGGIRGVRLTPLFGDQVDADTVTTLAAKIADLGWHMLFMPSDPEQWLRLAPLLGRLPVDVVVDHLAWRGWKAEDGLGQPGFKALMELAATGRAWMKLGGMYRYSREEAPWRDLVPYARAVIGECPDRIIWGSDWPHVRTWDFPMPDDDKILDWLLELDLDDAMIRKILVDNPAALYDFG